MLANAAADFILLKINDSLKTKPRCRIALPGGTTPARCLQNLSKLELPWNQIDWYMGDERCLPVGHEDRNDTMINQVLFSQVPSAKENFFPIHAELGPEKAAEDYASLFSSFDALDIVILGMGEDGHTASLFPGQEYDKNLEVVGVHNSPKPPADRVSLNYPTLNNTRKMLILIEGEHKRPAVQAWLAGEDLPISRVTGFESTEVYIDESAYPR